MTVTRIIAAATCAATLLVGASAVAQQTVLGEGWSSPADSRELNGRLCRPLICPADTNWMSFEVQRNEIVALYVYNLVTKERREICPPAPESQLSDDIAKASVSNRELAWRPVTSGGKVWAVFVSDVTGNEEMFLCDISSNRYYHLSNPMDSMEVGAKSRPAWSPDGKVLAYTTRSTGDANIWILRGMEQVLKKPEQVAFHEPLVTGEGDQFGAVWCPAPSAGLLAYNYIDKGSSRLEVRFVEARFSKSFGIASFDANMGFFAPGWSPDGRQVGYYQYAVGAGGGLNAELAPTGDSYTLGFAGLHLEGDSVVATPQRGGSRTGTELGVIDVAPNVDRFIGPAWTFDSKRIIVSTYDEPASNPLKAIIPLEWGLGSRKRDWMQEFSGGAFNFPMDISTAGRKICFSYQVGQARMLLAGQLVPQDSVSLPPDYLTVERERQAWYRDWCEQKGTGFFAKVGRFLWSPAIGPDLGVNKVGALAAGVAAYIILKPGPEPPPTTRNWGLPAF